MTLQPRRRRRSNSWVKAAPKAAKQLGRIKEFYKHSSEEEEKREIMFALTFTPYYEALSLFCERTEENRHILQLWNSSASLTPADRLLFKSFTSEVPKRIDSLSDLKAYIVDTIYDSVWTEFKRSSEYQNYEAAMSSSNTFSFGTPRAGWKLTRPTKIPRWLVQFRITENEYIDLKSSGYSDLHVVVKCIGDSSSSNCLKNFLQKTLPTNPDCVDDMGPQGTALHMACKIGNPRIVRLLLDAGANASLLNEDGKTAKQIASELKLSQVIDVFLKKDCSPDQCGIRTRSPKDQAHKTRSRSPTRRKLKRTKSKLRSSLASSFSSFSGGRRSISKNFRIHVRKVKTREF
eukprot:CAMPEP_0168530938 /NCGR_PEP_ID=MMETSP0405-20121227/15051_1 /TAXON_ID=498012 /ORGANISM="Trichosphaerium sp, Strain Am-I-7 wt" /LENGTH=346 /DNA_ID=CAMNT_0008555447 /DNA_START=65 /DNA_END=1105 /DNA_ORIENTATION=-